MSPGIIYKFKTYVKEKIRGIRYMLAIKPYNDLKYMFRYYYFKILQKNGSFFNSVYI